MGVPQNSYPVSCQIFHEINHPAIKGICHQPPYVFVVQHRTAFMLRSPLALRRTWRSTFVHPRRGRVLRWLVDMLCISRCHLYWICPLNIVIFHSYVSLPEGMLRSFLIYKMPRNMI
jgi:hypothetical protein